MQPDSSGSAGKPLSSTEEIGVPNRPRTLPRKRSVFEIWLQRTAISLFALLCSATGIFLFLLPWSLQWTNNSFLWSHPELRTFVGYGFVRGMCSGLGVLDIWIGFQEAVQYYEKPGA
jgi:hypothetical protein